MPPDPSNCASLSDRCTCPDIGIDPDCPMARGATVGHVKACPAGRGPCPCLPGSTSEAYCRVEALNGDTND